MAKRSDRSVSWGFGALSAVAACLAPCLTASAQEKYPSRPVEVIVPWGPGGGADQLARLTAKLLEPILGASLPVLNVPGATGGTGMAKLMSVPADGHAMAIYIADSHALLAGPSDGQRWKAEDIIPVAVLVQAPSFLFVANDSRFKSWAEFEAEARSRPGGLKVATLGFGSVDDFTLRYLESKGIKVVQVPFSRPSERYLSILGGHADALYEQAGDVAQFLQGGQMRPILAFGKERVEAFASIPSSYELGFEVALPQFRAMVVRAGTDPERLETLASAFAKVAATPEYASFLKEQFAAPDSFVNAAEAERFLQQQLTDMKALAGARN